MSLPEVHLVGGSRAEALRLAPVAIAMREQGRLDPVLLAAGPDPDAVDRTFAAFGLAAHITLPTPRSGAAGWSAGEIEAVRRFDLLWASRTPAAVVLRDSLAGALAAFWRRVPIMQLDAGRRSGDLSAAPDGLDADRRLMTQLASVHLAATPLAAMNLLDERVAAGDVLLTGSTATDAAQALAARRPAAAARVRRSVVISTAADEPIGRAVLGLTARYPDLEVSRPDETISCADRARLLAEAYVVVTDDEDLPEEALAAGVPVLWLGAGAGHAESLYAGSMRRSGPDPASIAAEVSVLLDSRIRRGAMAAGGNPYGDGLAAYRVAQATAALLGHGQFPDPMPARPTAGVSR
jgi:UDP-N-acetylglucosamine 2-epimerase (non-hydrolysing)